MVIAMDNDSDTIKIRAGFRSDLERAEKDFEKEPSPEKLPRLRWLRSKVAFYESEKYQEYKNAN